MKYVLLVLVLAAPVAFPPLAKADEPDPLNRDSAPSYTVQTGDGLWIVAHRLNITQSQLCRLNPDVCKQRWIYTGQRVYGFPTAYEVTKGDALWAVSQALGVSVQQVKDANKALLASQKWLYTGDVLYATDAARLAAKKVTARQVEVQAEVDRRIEAKTTWLHYLLKPWSF